MPRIRNFLAVNDMADSQFHTESNRNDETDYEKKITKRTQKAQQRQTYEIIFRYAIGLAVYCLNW